MMKVTKDVVCKAGIAMGLANKVTPVNLPEVKDPEKVIEVLRKQTEMFFDAITTAYIAQRIILDEIGVPEEEFIKMSEKYVMELAEDVARLNVEKELLKIMEDKTLFN